MLDLEQRPCGAGPRPARVLSATGRSLERPHGLIERIALDRLLPAPRISVTISSYDSHIGVGAPAS